MDLTNSFTASALAIGLSFTLSVNAAPLRTTTIEIPSTDPTAICQTSSTIRTTPTFYDQREQMSPREEALLLFGEQTSFTESEQETYWEALNAKSVKTGININDLF